ncbi:hypothetical protein C8R43DRAFT_1244972 [Mycena crocata]|nr:hypothetical protein C8R43DRAFT_1244972 [Mycena crocata]
MRDVLSEVIRAAQLLRFPQTNLLSVAAVEDPRSQRGVSRNVAFEDRFLDPALVSPAPPSPECDTGATSWHDAAARYGAQQKPRRHHMDQGLTYEDSLFCGRCVSLKARTPTWDGSMTFNVGWLPQFLVVEQRHPLLLLSKDGLCCDVDDDKRPSSKAKTIAWRQFSTPVPAGLASVVCFTPKKDNATHKKCFRKLLSIDARAPLA